MPIAMVFLRPFHECSVPQRAMNWNGQIGVSISIFCNQISLDQSSGLERVPRQPRNLSRDARLAHSQSNGGASSNGKTQQP